jgi:hypothetical protein
VIRSRGMRCLVAEFISPIDIVTAQLLGFIEFIQNPHSGRLEALTSLECAHYSDRAAALRLNALSSLVGPWELLTLAGING